MKKKKIKSKKPTSKLLYSKDKADTATILPLEIKGVLLFLLNVIMALSLITFSSEGEMESSLGLMGYAMGWALLYTFGLGSYLLILCLTYLSWRLIARRQVERLFPFFLYLLLMLTSFCMLLNVLSDHLPEVGAFFRPFTYTQYSFIDLTTQEKITRDNLGGVPLYYMYSDIPEANFKRILGNLGTTIIFSTSFFISLFLLTEKNFLQALNSFQGISLFSLSSRASSRSLDFLKNLKFSLFSRETPFEGHMQALDPSPTAEKKTSEELKHIHTQVHTLESSKEHTKATEDAPPKEKPPVQEKIRQAALQAQKVHNGDFTHYKLPSPALLTSVKPINQQALKDTLVAQANLLEQTLASFGIEAKVGDIHCGPTITSFELHPAVGVKVQKIKALENDIALNLKAQSIRIIAPIPGKAAVGIEVPNPSPQEVSFKEMLLHYQKRKKTFHVPVILGKTVSGEHVLSDLCKMPHCIIAGATGSGKSVCINTIIMSILMNAKPNEIKLLLVDPKKVELTPYNGLPHMIAPVITEPQGACLALNWLVKEMENRYNLFKNLGVRNIHAFNERKINPELEASLDEQVPEKLHYIVAIIDELADLMMVSTYDIESPISRIAQMARAVGIHLILATQRPSREVITGIIKANFPTRIAFKVASRINSQIILDETGAESLLGNGDLLFLPPGSSNLIRAQGAFIRDQDIQNVIEAICQQAPSQYLIDSFDEMESEMPLAQDKSPTFAKHEERDTLFEMAKNLVIETQNASTTFLQRKLKIGYARAASLSDQLEEAKIISPQEGNKARTVLIKLEPPE